MVTYRFRASFTNTVSSIGIPRERSIFSNAALTAFEEGDVFILVMVGVANQTERPRVAIYGVGGRRSYTFGLQGLTPWRVFQGYAWVCCLRATVPSRGHRRCSSPSHTSGSQCLGRPMRTKIISLKSWAAVVVQKEARTLVPEFRAPQVGQTTFKRLSPRERTPCTYDVPTRTSAKPLPRDVNVSNETVSEEDRVRWQAHNGGCCQPEFK